MRNSHVVLCVFIFQCEEDLIYDALRNVSICPFTDRANVKLPRILVWFTFSI